MRIFFLAISLIMYSFSFSQNPTVKLGIEVLRENGFDLLKGKRVGLITNPTGVDSKLKSTIDILHESKNVTLVSLFGPEHGVRGNYSAGDKVENAIDSATGLPMHSLYGKTRKPSPEMLKGLDVLVYDIQDVGCRSYTYISTMGLAMEAAAENNLEFIVLDRPNPIGGSRVEGNIVEKGFVSFVSQFPIPYIYGLTCGELAKFLNEEGLLKDGKKCKLTVVPMEGWKRSMTFEETGLQWVPSSPHIPEATSSMYYVTVGMTGELHVISEGVGYTFPFHTFAAEWIRPKEFADALNALNLDGVIFRPITFKPYYGKFRDKNISGVQIHVTDHTKLELMKIQFYCLQVHNQLYPEKNPFLLADSSRIAMFDKVAGSDRLRKQFMKRMLVEDISKYLRDESDAFKAKSAQYYLY